IGGHPIAGVSPRIGYMYQSHALLPWRTLVENVELGLELRGENKSTRRDKARSMLARLGLAGREHQYPGELSGGMRQRASLARTLMPDPEIVLMDEPFGALDAQTKIQVQDAFLEEWDKHRRTVVLVTHDLDEAIGLADSILVMAGFPGTIHSEHHAPFGRPREVAEMRSSPAFGELWH